MALGHMKSAEAIRTAAKECDELGEQAFLDNYGFASYAGLDVVTPVERTEQGQRGLLVGATATDAEGNPMQLMAITIQDPDHNRAIIARFPSSAATAETIADLEQIIGSFRTASG